MAEEKLQINISANFDGKGAKEAEKTIKSIGESAKNSVAGINKLSKSLDIVKWHFFAQKFKFKLKKN